MSQILLPTSSTPWERALADAIAVSREVDSSIGAMRRVKYLSPRPSMLPFLVWEYGLGELTPYVPNLYTLLDEGVRWQRLRGSASAVAIGLAWIGYSATIEEAWAGRRFWNSFQLRFPTLPEVDVPDLERIAGIASLSVPLRSKLRRGVYRYDAQPLVGDASRLDGSMLDFESGTTLGTSEVIWSFVRAHEYDVQLTQEEGRAAGYWIEPDWYAIPGGSPRWTTIEAPWTDANFKWSADGDTVRERLMAAWFEDQVIYIRLAKADGTTIGFRRARAVRRVEQAFGGVYQTASGSLTPSQEGRLVYVEALTQFKDADGIEATRASLMVGATRAPSVPIGRQWLKPDELSGGTELAAHDIAVPLRCTVREQFKFLLRFDVEPQPPILADDDFGLRALTYRVFEVEI